MLILRVTCTIISTIFLAAVIPVGAIVSWLWAGVCGLLAFLFYGLMLLFKQKQESLEQTNVETESSEESENAEESEKNEKNKEEK